MKILFTWFASFLFFASVLTAASRAQSPNDGQGVDASPVVAVHAEFFVNEESRTGELSVTATLRDGYHIYAMTQPKPFLATKIHVEPSDQVEVPGSFTPSRLPLMVRHDSIDVELHEYEGSIPFYAVFPAGNPNKPILLDGMFTSPQPILNALRKAVPTRSDVEQADAAVVGNRRRG